MIDEFRKRDRFLLVITPEGTRKKVPRWKSGFYRIATRDDVPIVLGFADYRQRLIGVGPAIYPSGDMERDMARIQEFYRQVTARHPDRT